MPSTHVCPRDKNGKVEQELRVVRNRRRRSPLIQGTKMTCPRCKRLYDILAYEQLMTIPEYDEETTPIYKCPNSHCRWLFAPAERPELILDT